MEVEENCVCSRVYSFLPLARRVESKVALFCFRSGEFLGGFGRLRIFPVVRRLCSGVLRVRQAGVGGRVQKRERTIYEPTKHHKQR